MTTYINTNTNTYPLFEGDLALENIDVNNLPDYISEVEINLPNFDSNNEIVIEKEPIKNEQGKWVAVFEIQPMPEKQKRFIAKQEIIRKVLNNQALTVEEADLLINLN